MASVGSRWDIRETENYRTVEAHFSDNEYRLIPNGPLAAVLNGGEDGAQAADALGLSGHPCLVLAVGPAGIRAEGASFRLERIRLLLDRHLSCLARPTATGIISGRLYCVIPTACEGAAAAAWARSLADGFVARAKACLCEEVLIGLATASSVPADLPRASAEASRVFEVMTRHAVAFAVADLAQVRTLALLSRLADSAAADPVLRHGPRARLLAYDQRHGTDYLATLEAYLLTFGDASRAAGKLNVHFNTVNNRIRKIRAISGLNLQNDDERLLAIIEMGLARSWASGCDGMARLA
ncbi:MAG: PucR family transcriptional regulator [Candidatus Dormibacteria bacterium]